jgi:hypothetical protein
VAEINIVQRRHRFFDLGQNPKKRERNVGEAMLAE